jgi:hypothetical protein
MTDTIESGGYAHEEAILHYGRAVLVRADAVTRWHIDRAKARQNLMPSDAEGIAALEAFGLAVVDVICSIDTPSHRYWFRGEPTESFDGTDKPASLLWPAWRAVKAAAESDVRRPSEDAGGPWGQAAEIEDGSLGQLICAFFEILDRLWQAEEGYMTLVEARIAAAESLAFAPGLPPMGVERQREVMRSMR